MESILSYNLENVDLNILKSYAYTLKENNMGDVGRKSSVNGFQSFEFYETNENVNKLFNKISEIVNTDFKNVYGIELTLGYYWVNINGNGSYNENHHHMGIRPNSKKQSIVSGVFYVEVPFGDSGNIIFKDEINIKPKNKDLLLFPASILHKVSVNNTNYDRISIAFNFVKNQNSKIKNIF